MSADLLCFREAHDARLKGEIDLEEFLRHIVAHYGGLRHHADGEGESYYIPGPSGFEDEVRDIVLRDSFQALDDDSKYDLVAKSSLLSWNTHNMSQMLPSSIPFSWVDFKVTVPPSETSSTLST
jgi:hypothetical protein